MSKFKGDIVKAVNNDTWSMMIENRLNKLFYEDRSHENRYGLHASAILAGEDHFCYREQVLSLFFEMNQGEQLPVNTLRIFAQGNAMHEKWYNLFRKAGIDVAIERTLYLDKYDLSFTIDALLNIYGEELVCDIKSQNTFTFQKSTGHPSGEKQVCFYLWALTKYTGIPHKKGFVLVDSKNDQEFRVVPVKYSKEKVAPYVERLKIVQELKQIYEESGELPSRLHDDMNCKRCKECGMHDACWNVGKGRIKIGKKEKAKKTDA